ncbi:MAG: hypothetical protein ABIP41_07725 [Croceibacterium sp.]
MTVALHETLPLPQRLALAYASPRSRELCTALFALDARLAAIVRGRREPLAAQVRLAWWRDRLAEPASAWPVGEPVLGALRNWRDPAPLAGLPGAWEGLLSDELTGPVISELVTARARAWVCLARQIGAARDTDVELAGRWWACADLAANLSAEPERALVLASARTLPPPPRLPAALRPLAVLARLGHAALARGGAQLLGGPRSMLLALRTGLTGL